MGTLFPDASIAVRMLTFEDALPDDQWWHHKSQMRSGCARTWACSERGPERLSLDPCGGRRHAGLIADLYGSVLVLQCHTPGMHRHLDALVEGFKLALGDVLVGVYDKSAKTLAKNGGVLRRRLGLGKAPATTRLGIRQPIRH